MDFERDIREGCRDLRKIKLDVDTRASLWAAVEARLREAPDDTMRRVPNAKGRRVRAVAGSVFAGAAAVLMVVFGSVIALRQGHVKHGGRVPPIVEGTGNVENGQSTSVANSGNHVALTNSPSSNPLFQTSLTLPNGQVVTPLHPVAWKDLNISLQVPTLPPRQAGADPYLAVVGNHSTVISHSKVQTSAGPADFVLNERTPPAAANTTTPTYEYWIIVYGSQYAYAIDAAVKGNLQTAKAEVQSLVNNWLVPGKTIPLGGQPITIAEIRKYYAVKQQHVVRVSSYPAYHAVIVESNRDPTIAEDFTWWNLQTGVHQFVAGRPEYMQIDHVVDADEVVLLATGANSESPGVSFPYYIVAKRSNADAAFTTTRETAYFAVDRTVSFGDAKVESLTRISSTKDGVSLQFGPTPGETPGAFAAGAYGTPRTTVSYVAGGNAVQIRLRNTRLRLLTNTPAVHNTFVSRISDQMHGTDTVITLHLTAAAKYYTGSITHHNPPTLALTFAAQKP